MSPSTARQARHGGRPRRGSLHGVPSGLTGPALRLLIGASVYREPAGRNALIFQIGQARPADATGPAGPDPAPPYCAQADIAELVRECEHAGLLVVSRARAGLGPARGSIPPVFVEPRTARVLHGDLAAAGRDDEIRIAHYRAAEYWQWRADAGPQDQNADLRDLLEARYHLHAAGDDDRAGTITEVVCAQLHAWGELDQEGALIGETLSWLPADSPLRAGWILQIAKIAQVQGDHAEAERRYWQAMQLYSSAGDMAAVSRIQHRLGILAQARGDYAEAERRYLESRSLARQPAQMTAESPDWPGDADLPRDDLPREDWARDDQPRDDLPREDWARDDQPREDLPREDWARDDQPRDDLPREDWARDDLPRDDLPREDWAREARRDRLRLIGTALAASALVALSVVGFIRAQSQRGGTASLVPAATRPASAVMVRDRAASWIARQLSRGAIVSCDPAMCAVLQARGIPAGNLITLGPAAEDPLGSDVVVATAAVRSQFGARLSGVYAPDVAASFGPGSTCIQVRVVAPDGAVAYQKALRADLLARKTAGSQLLRNKEISVTPAVRRQLAAGQVDDRLLTTLAALAAQHALRIVDFADSGPGASAGTPLRSTEITALRPPPSLAAGGSGNARFLRSALSFLRAQRPPYLAASLRSARIGDGQIAVQIQFAGPSPLGLLTAGGASADSSP
jgi:tetratricopeptide (TPR) repeat protein